MSSNGNPPSGQDFVVCVDEAWPRGHVHAWPLAKLQLQSANSSRLRHLRGCAAVLVVLCHFTLAFMPQYIGLTPDVDVTRDLIGSPVFVFLNGTAMVVIFFVLSGYVLAQKGLRAAASAVHCWTPRSSAGFA